MSDKSISEKYFEQYRQTKKAAKDLHKEIKEAKEHIEKLKQKEERLVSEIASMQRTITQMIDNGWDPVEAKLKTNDDFFVENMWNDWMNNLNSTITISSPGSVLPATLSMNAANMAGSGIKDSQNTVTKSQNKIS